MIGKNNSLSIIQVLLCNWNQSVKEKTLYSLISLRVKYALLFAESKSSPIIFCSNVPFTNNYESF